MKPAIAYRSDIDGLRSIAVISVVLFHLDVHWLTGGFVGVDVFFVISGYLITRLIVTEYNATGTFSFARFYTRRIRRLFPALFFTVLVTFLTGALMFTAPELERLGGSIVFALFSVSNFFFWAESGYFDVAAELKPLLHTWSLSVEEQFYMFWPLLLVWFLKNLNRATQAMAIGAVIAISLAANFVFADGTSNLFSFSPFLAERFAEGQSTIFFLTPFRIFELGIGGILVWLMSEHNSKSRMFDAIFVIALAMIVYPMFAYTEKTLFPSYNALLPCVGTALLILFGHRTRFANLVVTNPVSVFVGKVSYSLYLIHWPLIVYYKWWNFGDLDDKAKVLLFLVSLFAAVAMYYFIEQPFRHVKAGSAGTGDSSFPNRTMITAGALSLAIGIPAANAWTNQGWQNYLHNTGPISKDGLVVEKELKKTYKTLCRIEAELTGDCDLTKPRKVLVLGDSHAAAWESGLADVYQEDDIQFIMLSYLKCHADFKINMTEGEVTSDIAANNCKGKANFLTNEKEFLSSLDAIILASYRPFSYAANPFRFDLVRFIQKQRPNMRLVVLGNYFQTPPKKPCRRIVERRGDIRACLEPEFIDYVGTADQVKTEPFFKEFSKGTYEFIDVKNVLCGPVEECPAEVNGVPFMLDSDHLTYGFTRLFLKTLKKQKPNYLRQLLTPSLL